MKRLDYKRPDYLVEGTVFVAFLLDETATEVYVGYAMSRAGGSADNIPLTLYLGSEVFLQSLKINDVELVGMEGGFVRVGDVITVNILDDEVLIEVATVINPKENTALEGLFLAGGMLCTQCEAEGFRHITAYPDRPDVMAPFEVTLVGDKDIYPVLLSNGNLIKKGDIAGTNDHFAVWNNPFKMPCYLFAVVPGDLAVLQDTFTTMSGRVIALAIYAEARDVESGKLTHAMASLKRAMDFDERLYGRECDVDTYIIVAIKHFNMGAMENKGLNVFNTRFVLASPDTATDEDYVKVEGVIGHEYFHNWTGNRITCKDWFNLGLKEGFTVFRDQEFSRELHGLPIVIGNISFMRDTQFAEDAGPGAHPVRPEEAEEISNFYTPTVYQKGAEVYRMLQVMLGKEGFRKGSDLYFERHDGQAVGIDELVQCMSDANNNIDLSRFMHWFSYAGTPVVHIRTQYFVTSRTLMVWVQQSCPPTPGQSEKPAFYTPFSIGFVGREGDMSVVEDSGAYDSKSGILHITEPLSVLTFKGVSEPKALSLNRDFAPVKVVYNYREGELAFLMAHDPHSVARWDASQTYASEIILKLAEDAKNGKELVLDTCFADAVKSILEEECIDKNLLASMLILPTVGNLANQSEAVDPRAIHTAREFVRFKLGEMFYEEFEKLYIKNNFCADLPVSFEPEAMAKRAIMNVALGYMVAADSPIGWTTAICDTQFEEAENMTDKLAALTLLVHSNDGQKAEALKVFYEQFKDEGNVVNKWFEVQATNPTVTVEEVKDLLVHPAFDIGIPNHIYSVVRSFARDNPVAFHNPSGEGYAFLADFIVGYVGKNPTVAARIVDPLTDWKRYEPKRRALMEATLIGLKAELERLSPGKTKGVMEKVNKALME